MQVFLEEYSNIKNITNGSEENNDRVNKTNERSGNNSTLLEDEIKNNSNITNNKNNTKNDVLALEKELSEGSSKIFEQPKESVAKPMVMALNKPIDNTKSNSENEELEKPAADNFTPLKNIEINKNKVKKQIITKPSNDVKVPNVYKHDDIKVKDGNVSIDSTLIIGQRKTKI